jgi:hypothetical protein
MLRYSPELGIERKMLNIAAKFGGLIKMWLHNPFQSAPATCHNRLLDLLQMFGLEMN